MTLYPSFPLENGYTNILLELDLSWEQRGFWSGVVRPWKR